MSTPAVSKRLTASLLEGELLCRPLPQLFGRLAHYPGSTGDWLGKQSDVSHITMSSEQVTCDVAHFHKRGGGLAHQQVCSSLFCDSHLNLKQMEVSEHMSEQSTETCLTTNKLLYIAFEESGLNQNVYSQSNEAKQTVAPKKKASRPIWGTRTAKQRVTQIEDAWVRPDEISR